MSECPYGTMVQVRQSGEPQQECFQVYSQYNVFLLREPGLILDCHRFYLP
jgi:hypothetical protein